MDWKSAAIGAAVGFATEWTRRFAWAQYRLWLAKKAAEAEKTETKADDEAVADLIEDAREPGKEAR